MFCSFCGTSLATNANYCQHCGRRTSTNSAEIGESSTASSGSIGDDNHRESQSTNELITALFYRGYPYDAIVGLLGKKGIHMPIRTLKRRLKDLGLRRKAANYNQGVVRRLIEQEMQGAGSLAGCRYIWHALRLRHHMIVPRALVASIMKEIDPVGVKQRASRRLSRRKYMSNGPNFCWHIDGNY